MGAKAAASARPAIRLRAAATPASAATCQCSIRMSSSAPSWRQFHRAMSPADTMPSAANSRSSHTTPFSRVSPEPASQPVAGTTPMPTTTTSAASASPPASSTTSPPAAPASPSAPARWTPCTATSVRSSTPLRTVQRPAVRAQHGTDDVAQRDVERLEYRHPAPQTGAGRGHLGADEPGADHDDTGRLDCRDRVAQGDRVVERPQGEQSVSLSQSLGVAPAGAATHRWR